MRALGLFVVASWALAAARMPTAWAQLEGVWTVADGRKILPSDRPEEMPVQVDLFGMRNETLSFQIVVPAVAGKPRTVSLHSEGLSFATVEFFRVDSVLVSERSHGLVWKPKSPAEPVGFEGAIPDRLVPRTPGAALEIPASERQVFWVDLWIARDAPAGTQRGAIVVETGGGCEEGCPIPVAVEILDRVMPDEMHAKTMVWFSASDLSDERVAARYFSDPARASSEDKARLRLRHYQLARKHRLSFIGQHERIDAELDSLLSGRAFSEEMGYQGAGQGRGLDVLALHAYGGELTSDEATNTLAATKGYPDLRDAFVYVWDEPEESDYAEINRRALASKPMPSLVTTLFTKKLDTDIFAFLAGLYSRGNADRGKAAGKAIWIYNGERPFTGTFAIDDVAVSPRVNPWIQYKLAIPRWFYWEATYYFDFQGNRGAIDVARNALNFSNRHGDRVNGDGLLMYPGRDLLFPESDAGIDGPIPSIRLKNWRRGIEDVEYLAMARDAGFGAEVDALLAAMLPAVVDEVTNRDAVTFPEDAASWTRARRYLFELLRDGESALTFTARSTERAGQSRRGRWPWVALGLGGLLVIAVGWALRRRS